MSTSSLLIWLCLAWPGPSDAAVAPAVASPTADGDTKADWPQFRGPDGQGHAVAENLPSKWSETTNVAWKTPLPGNGWSSPVIHNGHIWMTAAQNDGNLLNVLRVNQGTGKLEKDLTIFKIESPGGIHSKNGHASPTPVIDNDRIYVHFGAHGTACLDEAGEILWTQKLEYYHHHGPAASPILVGDRLIIPCDGLDKSFYDKKVRQGVTDPQFVAALNIKNGDVEWRHGRQGRHSYATPLLIEVDGQPQIISPGGSRVSAYDPKNGDEIWYVTYEGYSLIPRPVYGHGLVFICTGYDSAQLLAIRPNGKGDVTQTHVEWSMKQGVPFTPSPLLVEDELYFVSDAGVATCVDAETGKVHWKRRLGGNFSASPAFADNKIFFQSEEGVTHVLAPGKQYKRLSMNKLNGTTYASPAIVGSAIYLRSDKALYRIEEKAAVTTKAKTAAPKSAKSK